MVRPIDNGCAKTSKSKPRQTFSYQFIFPGISYSDRKLKVNTVSFTGVSNLWSCTSFRIRQWTSYKLKKENTREADSQEERATRHADPNSLQQYLVLTISAGTEAIPTNWASSRKEIDDLSYITLLWKQDLSYWKTGIKPVYPLLEFALWIKIKIIHRLKSIVPTLSSPSISQVWHFHKILFHESQFAKQIRREILIIDGAVLPRWSHYCQHSYYQQPQVDP